MSEDTEISAVDLLEQPAPGFVITCRRCTGTNIYLRNRIYQGSEETAAYGSLDLYCRGCGFQSSIYEV